MSHPDEGLIHTWLDGELDAAEAARVEALVKSDPAWAAAAVEARGFIAVSARIVAKLDDVPANVVPATAATRIPEAAALGSTKATRLGESQNRGAPWWAMRAAALLVVATGTVLVVQRISPNDAAKLGENAIDQPAAAVPFMKGAAPAIGAGSVLSGANSPARAPASARTTAAATEPAIRSRSAAEAESKLKDARAGGGGAAGGAAGNVASKTAGVGASREAAADALRRPAVAGATANLPAQVPVGAPASRIDKARRDVADAGKSADERRAPTVGAAPSASAAGIGLRKEASALSLQSVVATSVASDDCFRELNQPAGAEPLLHRVRVTSDSTAVAVASGVRQAVVAASGQAQMRQMAAAPSAIFRLRGDTLFIGVVNGVTRIALRISCPAP